MSLKKIQQAGKNTQESLDKLEESLRFLREEKNPAPKAVFLDASIKRFEVLFEYTWKLLKIAAEYQGQEAPGPRPAIQEALRFKWIQDGEFWALALDARNGSVHDYFGITHEQYLKIMERFAKELPGLLEKISKLK